MDYINKPTGEQTNMALRRYLVTSHRINNKKTSMYIVAVCRIEKILNNKTKTNIKINKKADQINYYKATVMCKNLRMKNVFIKSVR